MAGILFYSAGELESLSKLNRHGHLEGFRRTVLPASMFRKLEAASSTESSSQLLLFTPVILSGTSRREERGRVEGPRECLTHHAATGCFTEETVLGCFSSRTV